VLLVIAGHVSEAPNTSRHVRSCYVRGPGFLRSAGGRGTPDHGGAEDGLDPHRARNFLT